MEIKVVFPLLILITSISMSQSILDSTAQLLYDIEIVGNDTYILKWGKGNKSFTSKPIEGINNPYKMIDQ